MPQWQVNVLTEYISPLEAKTQKEACYASLVPHIEAQDRKEYFSDLHLLSDELSIFQRLTPPPQGNFDLEQGQANPEQIVAWFEARGAKVSK